ncbi:MAG: lipopolysaccharide heptosyltransferase II [Sedimentisphaerales bacterium]|nr:lipopolysaccharide heptosyltransferase II [Sedimentisphaerales bacterium]
MKHSGSERILVWLPSPLGDAVMCTPALRALRRLFPDSHISFAARPAIRELLSPNRFNDDWLETNCGSFSLAGKLRQHRFNTAFLFKNSFGSALTVWAAGIPRRIGYMRDGRGVFLTDKVLPLREYDGRFRPEPMIDYYFRLVELLGGDITDRTMELPVSEEDAQRLSWKLPLVMPSQGPLVILVPGGAFGPSKCWPADRFAATAQHLMDSVHATITVSVAPDPAEREIADTICRQVKGHIVNLAHTPLTLGELKALFARADLIVTNDTGPRHIATALGRKVITLFGPNNPAWTQTGYPDEIQIAGKAPCAPCDKPKCKAKQHTCMESITVEQVCQAAEQMLEKSLHE